MNKLAVIGNCQASPLASALGALPGIAVAQAVPLHLAQTPAFKQIETELESVLADPEAVVFTFNVSDHHGRFSTQALRQRRDRVVTITNLHFSGLHPDVTYLGSMGSRLHSPMGDYHSRIVLDAFLAGCTTAECAARFNGRVYAESGYFDAYAEAEQTLLARDEGLDVKFAAQFLAMVPEVPTLYTMNHPTAVVIQAFAARLAAHLGRELPIFPVHYLRNHLGEGAWWPVYGEIAEAAGLKYRTPMVFQQPRPRGGKLLTLPEMIERSYAAYERYGERLKRFWPAPGARASVA
ncbi:WcbI family polysaccharide biosynthesis putative acetyltransferase [Ideonella sp.]|uniref:WcbI family polysaccharide biosynthesis putative acetyltransferase n=1 Tax=Ideonella sp. TaxID=1929293 RepID=UPI003BB5A4B5